MVPVRARAPRSSFLHWAHHPHDAFRSGPEMHARIRLDCQRARRRKLVTHVDQDFLLDVYEVPRERLGLTVSADEVRSSTAAMRDAVRRLAGEHAECGPARSRTSPTRSPRSAASTCAWPGWSRGTPTPCGSSTRPAPRPRPGVYGVWASRSAGTGVAARPDGAGWHLDGELRFASGIDVVDRALLPGWVDADTHLLFDVAADAVSADRDSLAHRRDGRVALVHRAASMPCAADDVVGPENFYLRRPRLPGRRARRRGRLGRRCPVRAGAGRRRAAPVPPAAHQTRRLGVMEQAVWQARTAVDATARRLPGLDGDRLGRETTAARTAVVAACEQVVDEASRIVGPGGLSGDARLARTLADLAIFVRQHHVDLALEAAGRHALTAREPTG